MRTFGTITRGLTIGAISIISSGCVPVVGGGDSEDDGTTSAAIINGTVPTQGALQSYGPVLFNACSGTLITNQHVLTAHHCVRDIKTGNLWQLPTAVFFDTPTGQIQLQGVAVQEANSSVVVNAADFALLQLDAPVTIGGRNDGQYRSIYAASDSSLDEKEVLCMGYGFTTEATATQYASGFGTLTWANLRINSVSVSDGWHQRDRRNGQVGFAWDSGSACFWNGLLTGIQSTCDADFVDSDGNGLDKGWEERRNTRSCRDSSPSNFRQFVEDRVLADASLTVTYVPSLPPGTPAPTTATVSTPLLQNATKSLSPGWQATKYAPRSGYFQAHVDEPVGMMCPIEYRRTPLTGSVVVQTTCITDGLLPSVSAAVL